MIETYIARYQCTDCGERVVEEHVLPPGRSLQHAWAYHVAQRSYHMCRPGAMHRLVFLGVELVEGQQEGDG
jgi:hypothetical protein